MFEWHDKLSVGNSEINKQHKKLLSIGRDLVSIVENTSEGIDQYDQIKHLIQELKKYTVYHFDTEEKLMEKVDYIDLPNHSFQHKMFVKKLEDINLEDIDLNQKESTMELLDFIATWVSNHIMESDMKYKKVLSD